MGESGVVSKWTLVKESQEVSLKENLEKVACKVFYWRFLAWTIFCSAVDQLKLVIIKLKHKLTH